MENFIDMLHHTNAAAAAGVTASGLRNALNANGTTETQPQQVSQTDLLMNGLVDPLAAEQGIQENADALPLPHPQMDSSSRPIGMPPSPSPAQYPQYFGTQNGIATAQPSFYTGNLQHHIHEYGSAFPWDSRNHPQSTWMYPAVTLPMHQAPPGFVSGMYPSMQVHGQGTSALRQDIARMTPTVGYTSTIGATSWDVHHIPHAPITVEQAATDTSAFAFMPAFEASGTSHVASTSSTATASSTGNRKRKRSSEEAATVPDATTGCENDATDGNAPISVAKRRKQATGKGGSSSTDDDEDPDDGIYYADVALDPEDPDWDMWIRMPSTAKKGPPAKETLVAAKLDWENPVEWSAVPADKKARAIRRICFWMLWSRARAEKHLDFRSKKWISEKKRRAADKEDPFRVKRSRKSKDDTVSASTSGVLPEISAVVSSTVSNSGASNEAPLFLSSSHDEETEYEENGGMDPDESGPSIGSLRDEQPPITANCLTSNVASETPSDVNTTMLSDVTPSRPPPEPSLLRALGPFLASVRRTIMARTAVPAAVLPNTASSNDESKSPGEPQNEAQHHESEQVLDGVPTANEEWLPELCRTG